MPEELWPFIVILNGIFICCVQEILRYLVAEKVRITILILGITEIVLGTMGILKVI